MRTTQSAPGMGFTIVELLIVVAIIALLAVLAMPALSSILGSSDLARGGDTLVGQVNLARQMANAQSSTIELRIIKLTNRNGYAAVQLWKPDSVGTMRPARGMAILPESVAISPNSTLSGAIPYLPSGMMPAGGTASGATYAAMQFRPSGMVTPILSISNLFLAVTPARSADSNQLPPNYFLLQVNPLTGVPLIYRP